MNGSFLFLTAWMLTMPIDAAELAGALHAPDPARRAEAAEQLARLGGDARPAAVPLVMACGDASEEVRQWAAAALEELGAPESQHVEAPGHRRD